MTIPWFKVSKGLLYISALYVALVVSTSLFPFIVGKYVWFRTSIDVALIAFLFGLILSPEAAQYLTRLKEILRHPLSIAVLVFVCTFVLACFFGFDPAASFWSNFERGEGGIQLLHLGVFYLLLATLLRTREDWEKMFSWVLFGATLMMIYGYLASFDVQGFIGARFSEPAYRNQGSIGNPAYVASYSMFCIFFSAILLYGRHKRHTLKSFGGAVTYVVVASLLVTFYLAATRGGFLGLVVACLVFLGYFAVKHQAWRRWLIAVSIVLAAFVLTGISFKDSQFVQSLPGHRIFDISLSAETFTDRTTMWKIAFDGWRDRPLFGWGPENYIQVFDRKFNTAYYTPGQPFGAWFDRAHSVIFDYLVETGAIGLIAFLGIFVVFYWQFFLTRRRQPGSSHVLDGIVLAFPVAYFVQGLVLFDVLPIYYAWYCFLAFATCYFIGFPDAAKKNHA
jgi:O-antigen ligase